MPGEGRPVTSPLRNSTLLVHQSSIEFLAGLMIDEHGLMIDEMGWEMGTLIEVVGVWVAFSA